METLTAILAGGFWLLLLLAVATVVISTLATSVEECDE